MQGFISPYSTPILLPESQEGSSGEAIASILFHLLFFWPGENIISPRVNFCPLAIHLKSGDQGPASSLWITRKMNLLASPPFGWDPKGHGPLQSFSLGLSMLKVSCAVFREPQTTEAGSPLSQSQGNETVLWSFPPSYLI